MIIEQGSFPEVWGSDCSGKRVRVDVGIPKEQEVQSVIGRDESAVAGTNTEWVTIPTTSVREYISKDGVADLQRSVKITFPTVWGSNTDDVITNNVRQMFTTFNVEDTPNPFRFVRVWYRDDNNRWVLTHFGYAGGVGPTTKEGESKVWVYDIAELLEGAPINATFDNPTVNQVLESVYDVIVNDTFVPLVGVTIVPPEREDFLADFETDSFAYNLFGDDELMTYFIYNLYSDKTPEDFATNFGKTTIFTGGEIGQALNVPDSFSNPVFGFTTILPLLEYIDDALSTKNFRRNHDTIKDILDWLAEKTQSIWHFEPVKNGVILTINIAPERRIFAGNSVVEYNENKVPEDQFGTPLFNEPGVETSNYRYHYPVTVIENNALYELNPINTVNLRGSTPGSFFGNLSELDFAGAWETGPLGNAPDNQFPVVKVQVPELLAAAEGVEIAPRTIESDASKLAEAEAEAITVLRRQLERVGEGEIILKGTPNIMPYDYVDAFEVCNDYIDIDGLPVRYEVETVEHIKVSTNWYITKLTVSIAVNDRTIETVEATMESIDDE